MSQLGEQEAGAPVTAQAAGGPAGPAEAVVPRAVFAVTAAAAFMVALDLSIVNVAFPSLRESFRGTSNATLSWVLSAYSIVFGALLLGAGRFVDRSGRKRTFQLGLAVFTLGSVLCGIAPEPWLLIAGRVVQAAGAALLMPASLAVLLSATPPAARAPAVAMWGGISALAVATGPSLGSVLVDAGGWRWAFFVNIPVAALAAWSCSRRVEESRAGGPLPDLAGIGVVTVAVAALALGITQGGDWGWTSAPVLSAFAAAGLLGWAAIARSARHPVPAIDLRVFETRTVALANAATFAYAVGFFAMLLGKVLFLTTVWGWSTLEAGLALTPGPLVVAALSRTTGRLAGRVGYRPVLVAGGLIFAVGELWLLAAVGTNPDYLVAWLPASLLVGLGVAFSFPVLSAAAVADLPPDRFGTGSAVNQTARQVGAVVGVALLVAVVGTPDTVGEAMTHFRHAWWLSLVASLGSAGISALQRRPAPVPAVASA